MKVLSRSGLVSRVSFDIDAPLADEGRTELLGWLGGCDQSAKHRQEYQKCVRGTGDWLLKIDKYVEWKANPGQLLWLNGIGESLLVCHHSMLIVLPQPGAARLSYGR
jgi:hypothetical protein